MPYCPSHVVTVSLAHLRRYSVSAYYVARLLLHTIMQVANSLVYVGEWSRPEIVML